MKFWCFQIPQKGKPNYRQISMKLGQKSVKIWLAFWEIWRNQNFIMRLTDLYKRTIELFSLNILFIFSGKNLMKKNIWHFIIFGKMNGPNQTPLPLTPGWLKVLPMGLCYIKAYFYWKIGRASKTNSNKLCCVLPNLKPKIVPWKIMMKISGWNLEVLYFLRLTRKVLTYFAMLMFLYLRYVMPLF